MSGIWIKIAVSLGLGCSFGLGLHHATLPINTHKNKPKVMEVKEAVQDKVPVAVKSLCTDDYGDFVSKNEGVRNRVYLDSEGIPTIGIGFNLRRQDAPRLLSSLGYDYRSVLSGNIELKTEDILKLFENDLKRVILGANQLVSNFEDLPDNAKLVVVDMVFNLGPSKFSKFRKTISALESLDFGPAADEMMDSRWYRQVGNRSKKNVALIRALSVSR
jgi:GH24 family phage-related lysozyme (muramidase)